MGDVRLGMRERAITFPIPTQKRPRLAHEGPRRTTGIVSLFGAALALAISALTLTPVKAAELIMFEEHGCSWCELWEEQIGVIYDRTTEGRRAPLRRVDIHDTRPEDLRHIKRVNFTPTFVLVEDGREYGRILGHPGEDFFWNMLQDLLAKLPKPSGNPPLAPNDQPFTPKSPRPQAIKLSN